jgi:predicted choloylglycine hydrolase
VNATEDPEYSLVKENYHHIVLGGSGYEAGKQLVEIISKDPTAKKSFSSGKLDLKKLGFTDWDALQNNCEECCPGITEEIQGFADGLGTSPDKIPFWNWTYCPSLGGNCSQLAVLSPATNDQHIYAGRSYEWTHTEEDLKLFTTRVKGKAGHIGFSCLLFGRHDGLNEHGLLVSMTGGGIFGVPFKHRGPMFWLVIRSLLDWCTSVDEAVERLESIPMAGYFSLMLADKGDNAAIVEFADGQMSLNRVTGESPEPYVFSVNHFRQPKTIKFNKLNCGIIGHSRTRETLITRWYKAQARKTSKESTRTLFAAKHPSGLCSHFYNEGFGTLWSMIFDVTQSSVEVCFSAPTHNKYHSFGLDDPAGVTKYPVIIPITISR